MLWTGGFAVNLPTPFLSMLFHCNLLEVCCFFTYVLVHCYHYSKWSRRNVWVDLKKVLLFAFKSHYHHDIYHCGLKNSSPSLRYEYAPHDKIGSHTERAIAIKNSRPEIQEGIREWKPLINSRIFFLHIFSFGYLNEPAIPAKRSSHTWAVSRIPFSPNQCWKISRFSNKEGKNHLIINIESWGREELTSCTNSFVWDCVWCEFVFSLRFGRKKVVVIGLVVAAIANLLVTVVPDDRDNAGANLKWIMPNIVCCRIIFHVVFFVEAWSKLVDL